MKSLIASLFISVVPIAAWASDCPTHLSCAPGQKCTCTVTADNYDDRYFYINFNSMQKGNVYTCTFTSNPGSYSILMNESVFPEGAVSTCTNPRGNNCLFASQPILKLDTTNMINRLDKMQIKYLAPASDYPINVSTLCTLLDH